MTRVLIVDDSAALRQRLAEMLADVNGLEIVAEAQSALEASSFVESLRPHLVVLDIQMPPGSGIEVLRQIKRDYPQMKVAIFTNYPAAQYRQRCCELKADYFLSKSTDFRLLIEIVAQLASERGNSNGVS